MKKFVCSVCGYVHTAEELAADFKCPVCKVPASKFEEQKGDMKLAAVHEYGVYAQTVKNNPDISEEDKAYSVTFFLSTTASVLFLLKLYSNSLRVTASPPTVITTGSSFCCAMAVTEVNNRAQHARIILFIIFKRRFVDNR